MSEQRKYIILSDGQREYAVIFDKGLAHVDVANGIIGESSHSKWSKVLLPLTPVSAGFVYVPKMEVDGWTGSESLKLKPRAEDQALLRGERAPTAITVPQPIPERAKRSLLERSRGARSRA